MKMGLTILFLLYYIQFIHFLSCFSRVAGAIGQVGKPRCGFPQHLLPHRGVSLGVPRPAGISHPTSVSGVGHGVSSQLFLRDTQTTSAGTPHGQAAVQIWGPPRSSSSSSHHREWAFLLCDLILSVTTQSLPISEDKNIDCLVNSTSHIELASLP